MAVTVTLTLADPGDVSPAEARAIVLGQLASWLAAGRPWFAPHELNPAVSQACRSRRWVFGLLAELRDSGVITPGLNATYTITRDPLGPGKDGQP